MLDVRVLPPSRPAAKAADCEFQDGGSPETTMPTVPGAGHLGGEHAGEIGALVAAQRVVGDEAGLASAVGVSTIATGTLVSSAISGAAVL